MNKNEVSVFLLLCAVCLPGCKTGIGTLLPADRNLLADGLVGWQQIDGRRDGWGYYNGVLFTKGGHGGWLATDRQYDDFRLELEFKVPPDGNSGVFVRAPLVGDPAYQGMEIQVLDDDTDVFGPLRPEQFTGSIYDVQAPSERATKEAGQWQKMVVTCKAASVRVHINGRMIIDTKTDYYPAKYDSHPGLRRNRGYIGLQDHGSRVEFRNIRIKQL